MSGESKDPKINKRLFWSRLKTLYTQWKDDKLKIFGEPNVAGLVILHGQGNEDVTYSKSLAVQLWLIGIDLTDIVYFFTESTLHIICGPKKASLLQQQLGTSEEGLNLVVHVKESNEKLPDMLRDISSSLSGKPRIGYLEKDFKRETGKTATATANHFRVGFELVDVSKGWAQILSVKDADGISSTKLAGALTSQVLKKFLQQQIEEIVDEDKKMKHLELADKTEEMFTKPELVKFEGKASLCESCFTPIIMSGGSYQDLKPAAQSEDTPLSFDTIVCQLGGRYKGFCANIARTYFINPTDDHKEAYSVLLSVYQTCLNSLRPGKKCSDIWQAATNVIKTKKSEFLDKLTKNCGFGLGLDFREPALLLDAKNNTELKPGMVFNLAIGLNNLQTTDDKGNKKVFSVLLADTVLVTQDEPETLTNVHRKYSEVSYDIGDEDEPEPAPQPKKKGAAAVVESKKRREIKNTEVIDEGHRAHQKALERKLQEEMLARLAKDKVDAKFNKALPKSGKFMSYSSPDKMLPTAGARNIVVDPAAESILLPVHGRLVPFHLSTIRNCHKGEEGSHTYLRITFLTPELGKNIEPPAFADKSCVFVRELTYRSTNPAGLSKVFADFKELKKRMASRQKEHDVKDSLVEQASLVLNERGPVPRLKDLSVRPAITRRRVTGTLSAHVNGFRYAVANEKPIDIIYKNIKAAFFQAAEGTINVLVHFELHNPIFIDSKKSKTTNFFQFYVEVVEASQDADMRGKYGDEDGLEEEQQERLNRQRWNERFRVFVKQVEDQLASSSNQPKIEFDIPFKELSFSGTANRASVTVVPSVHYLVALEDQPPLAMPLKDVEIAVFERVQFGLKNFDLAFVFKDHDKPIVRVDAIPIEFLKNLKEWLNKIDVKYYESTVNIAWKVVIKMIKADEAGFYADGGWRTMDFNEKDEDEGGEAGDNSEGGAGEESGSEFEPDGSSDEDDDDDDDSEDMADEVDEDESDDASASSADDAEEEEGLDWEEHERRAAEDDSRKRDRDGGNESEEERTKKKPKKK